MVEECQECGDTLLQYEAGLCTLCTEDLDTTKQRKYNQTMQTKELIEHLEKLQGFADVGLAHDLAVSALLEFIGDSCVCTAYDALRTPDDESTDLRKSVKLWRGAAEAIYAGFWRPECDVDDASSLCQWLITEARKNEQ